MCAQKREENDALTKHGAAWRHCLHYASIVSSLREWRRAASSIFNLWTPERASPPPYWLLSWLERIENDLRSKRNRKCVLARTQTAANSARARREHCCDGEEEEQAAGSGPEGAGARAADSAEEAGLCRRCSCSWRRRRRRCWAG